MSALEKAKLEVLDRQGHTTETIPVQFNPTTMQLQMTNSIDGGTSRGRQTQQYNGTSSTTLSLDLEFDTADEGTSDSPVDVRTRTAKVAQFLLPGGPGSKQAPPRVKFRWGTFELVGTMASLSEDLSLFASSGAPLRSKLSIQIKEQDPKYEALERGAGANDSNNPAPAGEGDAGGAGGPGTSGGGLADTAASALDGETPADFLARNGLAPEAWRALGGALDALADGIELEAGLSVEFAATLDLGLGLGASAGFQAGIDISLEAQLGLGAPGDVGTSSTKSGLQQGFALSAAGGVTAAAEAARSTRATAAADAARTSFGRPASPSPAPGSPPTPSARRPLSATPSARTQPPLPAAPTPVPPRADRRGTSYGLGVPLRDRVTVPGSESDGYVVIGRAAPTEVTGRSRRPGRAAPWERLAPSSGQSHADHAQQGRQPDCGCHDCGSKASGGRR